MAESEIELGRSLPTSWAQSPPWSILPLLCSVLINLPFHLLLPKKPLCLWARKLATCCSSETLSQHRDPAPTGLSAATIEHQVVCGLWHFYETSSPSPLLDKCTQISQFKPSYYPILSGQDCLGNPLTSSHCLARIMKETEGYRNKGQQSQLPFAQMASILVRGCKNTIPTMEKKEAFVPSISAFQGAHYNFILMEIFSLVT